MTNGSEIKSAGAKALRAAGYKPCPRWWLTDEQMELVAYMAAQNADDVNRIRAEAQMKPTMTAEEQIDAAWKKWRQERDEKVEAKADHSRGAPQEPAAGST